MVFLTHLKTADIERKPVKDPVTTMRSRFIKGCEDQILLAQGTGKQTVIKRKWFFPKADRLYSFLRYGNTNLELPPSGETAVIIEPPTTKALVKFYQAAIRAAERGELDSLLQDARRRNPRYGSVQRKTKKKKKKKG